MSVADAEPGRGEVGLGLRLDESREPRRPPHQHHQQPGRERIERPGVTHRPGPERAPHALHHVVRREPGRLVHQQPRRSAWLLPRGSRASSSLIRAACSSPRSSSKCSSGTMRVVSALRQLDCGGSPRRSGAPRGRASCSASSPGTLTMTRACERSLVTCTPVTVTNPTRGIAHVARQRLGDHLPDRLGDLLRAARRRLEAASSIHRRGVHDPHAVGLLDRAIGGAQHLLHDRPSRCPPPRRRSRPAATGPGARSRRPRR